MAQESVLRIVIDSRNAERNARAVAGELENLTKKGDQAETQMTAMSASIKSLVGYMGGILTINKAIAMADGYTQMAARIRNATSSAEEYAMVQDRVLATANTTYRQLGEAQEVYLSMAGGMKSLGYQTTQTLDLVDSLSFSFTHNATRTDQAQSAMDSLSKSMAKGKIDADAWISIVTGADNVIADMAKTTGKSEAEIRKLGATGKISLEELIKTLIATRNENEKLANNMENSLADGFTKLSNEVTVYLGKANEATSATGMLAGGLSSLADNLDAVANTGAVLGIGYVTSALLTKGAAVKAGLVLSAQRKIADQAELVSQTQLTAAEARRTASIAQYTQMQLADAKATAARMTGMQRLAYVQSTVIPLEVKATQATAAHTAATNIDTAAQELNNKVRSRGAMLLGILGGPIGAITTGVMALAAGYAYMSYRTSEANAKLEEQGKVAEKTHTELQKLTGNDKKNAVSDLTAAFSAQNETLAKSKEAVDAVLFSIRASAVENEKARKVAEDARNGLISYNDAIRMLNEMDIRPDLYEMLKKQAKEYDVNSTKAGNSQKALKSLGIEVKLSGNSFQNAVNQIDKHSEALDKNKTAAQKAAEGLEAVRKSLFDREYEAYLTKALLAKGYSEDQVRVMIDTANFARKEGIQLTNEMYQAALKVVSIEEQNKKVVDSRNAAERERTKELEKQQKVLTASSKVQANAAKYNFAGLESKYGLPSGTLSAIHAIETGNTGKSNQVNKQSGATGGFQFLEGTAKQYGVKDRTDLAQSAEGAAKYMSYLLKLFKGDLEKAVRAYHAGEGNVQKGKNIGKYNNDYWQKFKGYTAGVNGFTAGDVGSKEWEKLLEEAAKMAEQQAELRKNLEFNIASEVKQIRSRLAEDLEEIDKAGYSPERAKELKAEYQARADNDIAIAQQALKTKLDDYAAFKKTESQLLEDSFNEQKFYAARDLELTKEQRDKAVALLDEQLKQELGYIKLAQETQLFQAKQAYMHEVDLMQERYRLEMQEIDKIADAKQRAAMREATAARLIDDYEKKRKNAEDNFNQVAAKIGGFEEYYALQKEMEDSAAVMEEARKYELISEEEHKAALIEIEKRYMDAKMSLNLSYGQQIAGSVADMFKQEGDKQNKYYKAAITAEKAFSIARAMIAIKTGIALAANNPWPLNLAAMASVAAQTASIVSDIRTIHVEGLATGGKIRGAGTPTSDSIPILASDREYMVRAYAAEKLGTPTMDYINKYGELPQNTHRVGMGAVSAINSGRGSSDKATMVQPIVNIHTLPGETADVSWNDGRLDVRIRKITRETINGDANDPNSGFSKAMKRNFTVSTKR